MSEPADPRIPGPAASSDAPDDWRGSSPLIDLQDPRLRLKARALTQLSRSEREKALAVYAFVKRQPFSRPMKLRPRTARQTLDAGTGDAPDKATLFVALLRLAGIPARQHWVQVHGQLLRGLLPAIPCVNRPIVEVWLQGRWVPTDTFIFDAAYVAAARQRLRALAWDCGWGICLNGHAIWDGLEGAWLGGMPTADDPLVLRDLGRFHDTQDFSASDAFPHRPLARSMKWNLLGPRIDGAIRRLRAEAGPQVSAHPPRNST
ncbi:MAG TPA: transglutaminase-like domain-containing protein [Ramlibacter sp.]|uniref:transglutaminase-like domain-containing protein n=1 Tax=Ramlibacter sp. TaxID=1917967 RepID=UPI002D3AC69C|nr:transglutaminase-like domain-containing protein [Ramlibacter sp.]HZY17932.1 transglutaminase-like domain-containing protein [Ramlibacter sp.]